MRLLVATVLASFAVCASAQAAVVCSPEDDGYPPFVLGDVDDDNQADIAVGLPGEATVVVRQTARGTVTLDAPAAGMRFGNAVALGDVDGDSCSDVVVGAPGANQVLVYRGSPTGILTAPVVLSGAAGDDFGAAVAVGKDLWVGAPGHDMVQRFTALAPAGTYTARHPVAGERFGAPLAPDVDGVFVGVPRRGQRRGGVEQIRLGHANRVFHLPHPRRGDRFGITLAAAGDVPVAGAPGRRRRRGAVAWLGHRVWNGAHRGDRFGAAVAVGRAFTCQEDGSIAAGAPGADTVRLISLSEHCGRRLHQPGIGGALGRRRYRDDFDEDTYDTLLIGRPAAGRVRLFAGDGLRDAFALPSAGRQVIAVEPGGRAF